MTGEERWFLGLLGIICTARGVDDDDVYFFFIFFLLSTVAAALFRAQLGLSDPWLRSTYRAAENPGIS